MDISKLSQSLKDGYRKILIDPNFERLEQLLDTPNIFRILKAKRTEIRHSNFLWWLLDPNESHWLNEKILIKVLRDILLSGTNSTISIFDIEDINFRKVEVLREHQNIDILIKLWNIIVCIENKFDTNDHTWQLLKYKNIVEKDFQDKKHIFIYLTPTGTDPKDETMRELYQNYSYIEFIRILELILLNKEDLRPTVLVYLEDYLTTIKQEIIGNDESNRLENELFNSHKEFLSNYKKSDFLISQNHDEIFTKISKSYIKHNKRISEWEYPLFLETFESLLKKHWYKQLNRRKNGIHFTTDKILEIAGELGDDKHGRAVWSSNSTMAFAMYPQYFLCGITHLTDNNFRDRLNSIIIELPDYQESKDRSGWHGWHTFWNFSVDFDSQQIENMIENDRYSILDTFFERNINPRVGLLEDLLIKNKEFLINGKK